MIPPQDFSHKQNFPGTRGNVFDVLLHRLEDLDHLHTVIFGLLLLVLTGVSTLFYLLQRSWIESAWLFTLILLDWLLIAWLPRTGRSYGPVKPAVLLLALGRGFFALLSFPLWVFLALQTTGTAAVIYGFWIEPFRLQINFLQLQTPKLAPGASLKLLHFGDLHMERRTRREEHILQAIQKYQPDIILFSGDILNLSYLHDPLAWQEARQFIEQLQASLGVYFVTGSPAVDLEEILPDLLKNLPIQLLRNEIKSLPITGGQICLVGTDCTHRPFVDGPTLETLTADLKNTAHSFNILLHHSPDLAPIAAGLDFDLQLSGHTHGGQVRLPLYGALFTASLYGKRFEAGMYPLDQMLLYITRGVGLEGAGAPRVRFLCRPEMIFWEITSSQ